MPTATCPRRRSRSGLRRWLTMPMMADAFLYSFRFVFKLKRINIRHIQHHTGELCERIGAQGGVEFKWVKMKV